MSKFARFCAGLTLGGAVWTSSCVSGDSTESIESTRSAVMCGVESRSAITTVSPEVRPVGKVQMSDGSWCTGTIIGPHKVMTAAHCLPNNLSSVQFEPQFGIVTTGVSPFPASSPIRSVEGDAGGDKPYADWAILTFVTDFSTQLGANYGQMDRQVVGALPRSVSLIGYADGSFSGHSFSNRPGKETGCSINVLRDTDGQSLRHSCDVEGGASGGPLYVLNGSQEQLVGVQSGNGSGDSNGQSTCIQQLGNTAASGTWYSFAPDHASGVALAHKSDGKTIAFASDSDWHLVASREKTGDSNSAWTPWTANDAAFASPTRMTAVNLSDNRIQLFTIGTSGAIQTRWQALDLSWQGWSQFASPVPVRDIAASGSQGVPTHLFALGTDNVVRLTFKTGDINSPWSAWTSLGTVTGAQALSAVNFQQTHQVFVVGSGSIKTTWGSRTSIGPLADFGTVGTGSFLAVASGLISDGRVTVIASLSDGSLFQRIRSSSGSWSAWSTVGWTPPPRATGVFQTLTMGRLQDGRAVVLGILSDANIYQTWESTPGAFNAWQRFYD